MNNFAIKCYDEIDFRLVRDCLIKIGYWHDYNIKNYKYSKYILIDTESKIFMLSDSYPQNSTRIELNNFIINLKEKK